MKFWEAMRLFEEGKKVRCETWHKDDFISCEAEEAGDSSVLIPYQSMKREWELYEEPVRLLSFAEVVNGLKEGKKFKRKGWGKDCAIIHAQKDAFNDISIYTEYGNLFSFCLEDFEANDWIEVK